MCIEQVPALMAFIMCVCFVGVFFLLQSEPPLRIPLGQGIAGYVAETGTWTTAHWFPILDDGDLLSLGCRRKWCMLVNGLARVFIFYPGTLHIFQTQKCTFISYVLLVYSHDAIIWKVVSCGYILQDWTFFVIKKFLQFLWSWLNSKIKSPNIIYTSSFF